MNIDSCSKWVAVNTSSLAEIYADFGAFVAYFYLCVCTCTGSVLASDIKLDEPAHLVVLAKIRSSTTWMLMRHSIYMKCTKLPMVNGKGVANGTFTSSSGKIGSAHTLPARVSEEPEEVLSTAETPLASRRKRRGSP